MTTATRPKRKTASPAQAALPFVLPEGVHLGLPNELYHEQRALGSSDFHILATDTPSWWFASPFNPERREKRKQSRPLVFGSALHALILEGEQAYTSRFIVEPDSASNQYRRGREAMLTLLAGVGVKPVGRQSWDDAYLHGQLRKHGLSHRVWETAYADYVSAKKQGKQFVTSDEDRRLRRMADLVGKHPDLGPNLRKGLAEVSVLYRREDRPDILLRARWDYLLPGFDIDLKSFSNTGDKSPEEATFDAIAVHGYDLQPEHYREAKAHLRRFVREGRVYSWGARDGQIERVQLVAREKDLLKAIAAEETARWVWIFYQVQSDDAGSERAPIVVPWWISPEGPLFEQAREVIERALNNYTTWVNRCGTTQPWSDVRPILPLPVEKLRRLQFKRSAS